MQSLDVNTDQQIKECVELLKDVLQDDLLGVCLYGSSLVGGLQRYSDLDLFVISDRPTTLEDKTKLVSELLNISGVYRSTEKRPIELTIVVKSEVNPWHYPPNFDFQYGDWLRGEFEAGKIEPWSSKAMPDLALLITQVLLASRALYGKEPNQLLAQVPYGDFISATTDELDSLRADLEPDTRNVLLTFARIWMSVETDTIGSKQKAAEWVIGKLPEEYKPVMHHALLTSLGKEEEKWDDMTLIQLCADFMVYQIKMKVSELDLSEDSNKTIKLAE